MKFYSYELLFCRNIDMNRVQLVVAAVLFLVLLFNDMRYFKDEQISRYRELALIALLLLITVGLLQINRYREMRAGDQWAKLAIHSVECIAKELDVPAEEVFLSATEFSENPIIFAKGRHYRMPFINDTSCNLEPVELLGTEPEFIRERSTHSHAPPARILIMLSFFNNFYFLVAIKLLISLLSLFFVINVGGKGNPAPSNASDQIQNCVLGGIIGGIIYNNAITVLQYILILLP